MPSIRVTSNGVAARTAGEVRDRARNILPATQVVGEYVAREARRRAPRSGFRNRGSKSLRASLNHAEPKHNVTMLQTPKVYGPIQQSGGTITPVSARALAIPLSDDARKIAESLPAGLSLRSLDLVYIKSKSGKAFLAIDKSKINRQGKRRAGQTIKLRQTFANPMIKGAGVKMGRPRWRRRATGRRGTAGRRHRPPDRSELEFLFILVSSATLRPNPAPRGYAPRVDEPPVHAFINKTVAGWVLRGRP